MDEKTAELRELFVETTGAESVTESQADSRGTLSSTDGGATAERLGEVIATMRERSDFASSLPEADLRRVVRGFFDPDAVGAHADSWSREADAALAASLEADADADAVFRARMDLHLVADADRDSPFPFERLRRLVLARTPGTAESALDDESLAAALAREDAAGDGLADEEVADEGAVSEVADDEGATDGDTHDSTPRPDAETVRRYRRVVEADLASRGVNHRFRDAFAELLTDADLSTRLAEDARRDGLREATEDIETDVSL